MKTPTIDQFFANVSRAELVTRLRAWLATQPNTPSDAKNVGAALEYSTQPQIVDVMGVTTQADDGDDDPIVRCESHTEESPCGPVVTADSEGVPLCMSCAWEIDREEMTTVAKLVGFDRGKHGSLSEAVTERLAQPQAITPEQAVAVLVAHGATERRGVVVYEPGRAYSRRRVESVLILPTATPEGGK